MAKLKTLPKMVIIGAVVGGIGYAVHLSGVLNKVGGESKTENYSSTPAAPTSTKTAAVPAKTGKGDIGSASNPLKISFLSFHGYAPGLIANGGGFDTASGSINDKLGVNVKYNMQDDFPDLTTIWESGSGHCVVRTSDFWSQIQPNLRNSGHDGKVVMLIANTRGGDAIIAKDQGIRSVEDLAGKSVALLQYTPSHGLLIDAIENSSLSAKKKQSIKMVFINADEGTAGVRAAYESGKVDAAVLWDPDLSLAAKQNSHVVYSTKTATNLIYDVMICDQRVINNDAGKKAIQSLVSGWMDATLIAEKDLDQATDVIIKNEKMFELLAKDQGKPFVKSLFNNVDMTGLEDNARILGMAGGTNHYERVYKQFDGVYRAAGALANPKSPVINPQDSIDYSFIKNLLANNSQAAQAAAAPTETFTSQGLQSASQNKAAITKPVAVRFDTGSFELSQRAKKQIDDQMVPFIENNGKAYIEISGNTDSSGSDGVNKPLSQKRAAVVVDYLVKQWDFPVSRFKVTGNGSAKPICNEANPSADGLDIESCKAENRTTRVGIFGQ
jgi:outer membrane protein OmpA-like peptidoglycan-associated protein